MSATIRSTVFTIKEILKHPNADKLELVQPLGWQVVTEKGLRKSGDRCVYIQPDSIVPDKWSIEWGVKQYLKGSDKNRVGQIRLRGEPSFGFIVGLPEELSYKEDGEDVSEYFGITKYEPPLRVTCGDADKDHPLFPKYTDIENLRNFPELFTLGEEVIAAEKCHGTNCRIGVIEGEIMAGSMNYRRKRPENNMHSNTYWFPYTIESVKNCIDTEGPLYKQFILFGEVYGSSIQKGYSYDTDNNIGFRVFDILRDGRYVTYDEMKDICDKYGVQTMPVLYRGPYSLKEIKRASEGGTVIGENKHIREGVVVRPVIERTDPKVGRLVLKYINDEYLLSKKKDYRDI